MSALSLPVARAYLQIKNSVDDMEVQDTIDAAEAILANSVGPLTVLAQRTDRVLGGSKLILPLAPVVSVASITAPDGTTVDQSTLTINTAAGVIYFSDGVTGFWQNVYDVTYTPGRATVPGDLLMAVKEMVRHLWRTQRGPAAGSGGPDQQGAGYLMPYRVQELIEPYRLITVGAA